MNISAIIAATLAVFQTHRTRLFFFFVLSSIFTVPPRWIALIRIFQQNK